jgi:DNA-binding phage protein
MTDDKLLAQVRAKLKRVENLSAFALLSGLPRSTLDHLRNGNAKARAGTLMQVKEALGKYKPRLLPKEPKQ